MVYVELSFAGFTVNSDTLPDNSIEHLLRLGFSTAIKNSIAGVKAGVLGNGANPWSDDDIANEAQRLGIGNAKRNEETAALICAAIQREMFESIVSGVARKGRTSSPRMSDDEKLRETIAIEQLTALAKKSGKPLPKRSKPEERAAFTELLAKALASEKVSQNDGLTFAQRVEKEFKVRKKAASAISDDFDDLI